MSSKTKSKCVFDSRSPVKILLKATTYHHVLGVPCRLVAFKLSRPLFPRLPRSWLTSFIALVLRPETAAPKVQAAGRAISACSRPVQCSAQSSTSCSYCSVGATPGVRQGCNVKDVTRARVYGTQAETAIVAQGLPKVACTRSSVLRDVSRRSRTSFKPCQAVVFRLVDCAGLGSTSSLGDTSLRSVTAVSCRCTARKAILECLRIWMRGG